MSRGYGNRARYERRYQQTLAASAQVGMASGQATMEEAIEAVEAGVPVDLADTIANFELRINNLEHPA